MAPLVALGISLLPILARQLAGERAGAVAADVAQVVQEVTGTADPLAARKRLDDDPVASLTLRQRLAEIALEADRLRAEAEERRRRAEFETLQARLADVQAARGTMVQLAGMGSGLATGPAMVSAIVTLGFFATMGVFIFWTPDAQHQQAYSLLNIAVGSLVAGFTAVVNFWIGSSQGSRDKDETVRQMARQQTALAGDAVGKAQAAMAGIATPAGHAPAPPPQAAPIAPPPPATEPPGARFERCLALVLAREGGFSHDPADPGGPTNLGITQAVLARWRGAAVTAEEVAALDQAEAREIYRSNYWNLLRCDDLPPGVDLMVFDCGVNAGPGASARLLQRAVGVREDGSVGPITLAAAGSVAPADCIERLARHRAEFYRGREGFARFGRGWTARTDIIRRAALAMAAG